MQKLMLYVFLTMLCWFMPMVVMAAPLFELTSLPLSAEDMADIKNEFKGNDEKTAEFIESLHRIKVYEDHNNPKDFEKINDKKIVKNYWLAPFLSASEERDAVGNLTVGHFAIKVISEVYRLISILDIEIEQIAKLSEIINGLSIKKQDLRNRLEKYQDNLDQTALIEREIAKTNKEEEIIRQQIRTLQISNGASLEKVSKSWRERLFAQIFRSTSFIGISPTSEEIANMQSDNAFVASAGITEFIARMCRGQFAIQQVMLEAGFTKKQLSMLVFYLKLRPDVSIKGLATEKIYVRPAMQSSVMHAQKQEILPLSIIKGINDGYESGACGGTSSCNIIIEYTFGGAQVISTATTGTMLLPVWFEAEANFISPAFKGSVTCQYDTGWTAQGRADIKDGGIIYDGDLSNSIKTSSIDDGQGCQIVTAPGSSRSSGEYHLLKELYSRFNDQRMERAQKARSEKEVYKKELDKRLQQMRVEAENNRDSLMETRITRVVSSFFGWHTIVSEVVSEIRGFYWHTTNLDISDVDKVNFTTHIDLGESPETKKFAYDAFPVVCWRKAYTFESFTPYPAACSVESLRKTPSIDNILGTSQQNCGSGNNYANCFNVMANAATNASGELQSSGF